MELETVNHNSISSNKRAKKSTDEVPIYMNGYIPHGRTDNNTTRIGASAGAWMGCVTTSYAPTANFIYELYIPSEYIDLRLIFTPYYIPYSTLSVDVHSGHMLGCMMVKEVLHTDANPNLLTNIIYPGDIILRIGTTDLVQSHTSKTPYEYDKYRNIIENPIAYSSNGNGSSNSNGVWKVLRLASASYNNINKISPIEIAAYLNTPTGNHSNNDTLDIQTPYAHYNPAHVSAKLKVGLARKNAPVASGIVPTSTSNPNPNLATPVQSQTIHTSESVAVGVPIPPISTVSPVASDKSDELVFNVFLVYLHPYCPIAIKKMLRIPSVIDISSSSTSSQNPKEKEKHLNRDKKKSFSWKNPFDHTQSAITNKTDKNKLVSNSSAALEEEEKEWDMLFELQHTCGGGVYLESRQKSNFQHPQVGFKTRYVALIETPTAGSGAFSYIGVYMTKIEALYAFRMAVKEYMSTGCYRLKGGVSMFHRISEIVPEANTATVTPTPTPTIASSASASTTTTGSSTNSNSTIGTVVPPLLFNTTVHAPPTGTITNVTQQ